MSTSISYSLKSKNSFAVEATTQQLLFPSSYEDLLALPCFDQNEFYILGEGSNTLFTDTTAPIIISPNFTGIEITETQSSYFVKVGASENWHNLVQYCISNRLYGLENLALIPGSAGAAPVQNIGAYGVEFSDFCFEICWFEFESKTVKVLNKHSCQFDYRESIFKSSLYNKGLIISITLKLPKKWQANLSYHGLNSLPSSATAEDVMGKVIELRESKLPNPKKLPNAGSFFKNPIVTLVKLDKLKAIYPEMPFYPQADKQVKLAAGWLIEQCGLKGYRMKSVGVHDKQALVLVNYSSNTGKDIVDLARYVQASVNEKFAIKLQPEVKVVTASGEVMFDNLEI